MEVGSLIISSAWQNFLILNLYTREVTEGHNSNSLSVWLADLFKDYPPVYHGSACHLPLNLRVVSEELWWRAAPTCTYSAEGSLTLPYPTLQDWWWRTKVSFTIHQGFVMLWPPENHWANAKLRNSKVCSASYKGNFFVRRKELLSSEFRCAVLYLGTALELLEK